MAISYPLVVGAQVIDTNRPGFTCSPATALLLQLSVPTCDDDFSSGR